MRIKRFLAPAVEEAVRQVRREFGPDALLLQVRTVHRGWLARLGLRRPWVEVVAALDDAPPPPVARREAPVPEPAAAPQRPDEQEAAVRPPAAPAAPARGAWDRWLDRLPAGPPPDGRVMAVVGPTGAGKTTSLAKLAARAAVLEGRRVALVTLDTFRVGAVEQLRIYGEIMGVPLHVADTPEAVERALAACADAERVFVDTPGRHPGDRWTMARLRRLLEAARPDAVHLVVPAYARPVDVLAYAPRYRELGADRLLVTKLDETDHPAALLELPRRLGLPLSYLAFGQEVPDDIAPATPEAIRAQLERLAGPRAGRRWA